MTRSTNLNLDEISTWLVFLRAPQLGAVSLRKLLDSHATIQAAYDYANCTSSAESGIPESARAYLHAPDLSLLEKDRTWLEQPQHFFIPWTSADYPILLRDISGAPAALFGVGNPHWLWSPQLAIVGSRNASAAGIITARSFAKVLAQQGIVITSGLADGIDGGAHAAALEAQGATIAVMGTGPDLIYPRKHRELAEKIAAHGALITEFPPGTPGKAEHFPRRNRIIAGLSLGTLVVEASLQSGSLITARLAAEQGREVFAVPGSIHNPLARGCHQLIRHGAKLTETAGEILEELGALASSLGGHLQHRLHQPSSKSSNQPAKEAISSDTHLGTEKYDSEYRQLLAALSHDPISIDQLAERTGLVVSTLSSMLLVLELDGVVVAERGGMYMKTSLK